MTSIMPESKEPDSGWNTTNHYFYEIRNLEGKEFYIQLVFSSENITEEQRNVCEKINSQFPSRIQKKNWTWRTCFTTKHCKVDNEMMEDKIYGQLSKQLEEINDFVLGLKSQCSAVK